MSLEGIFLGVIAALGVAVAALFKLWRRASNSAARAERTATTHKEMRDHEQEAMQMDDTTLADRITRKP